MNATGGYPAGCDPGPAVVGFGDMFNDGTGWVAMSQPPNSLNYNWNIEAYVEPSKKEAGTTPVILTPAPVNNPIGMTASTSGKINTSANASFNSGSGLIIPAAPLNSTMVGYNVYRTDDNTTTPFHLLTTPPLPAGTTTYADVHPATTDVTTSWLYYVAAVFENSVAPGVTLCEGASDTISILFPAVGFNNLDQSSISIYPNPASTMVTIQSTNTIKAVEVLNYVGQMIYSNTDVAQKKVELSVSTYNAGVYFVKVTTSEGVKTTKITVTH